MGGLLKRKRRSSSSSSVLFLPLFWAFFLAIFLERLVGVVSGLEYSRDKQASSLTLERIRKHLDKINKPASPDGDIIDCIDKWKQPAFDHPLLKNHELQLVPPEMPRVRRMKEEEVKGDKHISSRKNEKRVVISGRGAWQVWHQNRTRCPKGTVPIRRTTVDDALRAQSLYEFGKKQPRMALARHTVSPDDVNANGHEYAIATSQPSEAVYGAAAEINVWNPSLQVVEGEMSISQIWVVAGSFVGSDLNSVEAGWHVLPHLYGDKNTRLFAFWTADGYQSTGCYNTLCPGFVQVDKEIVVGAAIAPAPPSPASYTKLIFSYGRFDPKTENWWLGYENNTVVGYWPSNLFTHLAANATLVEGGGEVLNTNPNGAHTSTQMGSGRFAQEGYGNASYFRNLGLVDSNNNINSPQSISTKADNSNCYNIDLLNNNNDWGTHFFYRGLGFNPNCP
ncbi:hypothetical protein PVL29_004740 [Vitis rotundifolia]|uniref:Neprosin PEP catalytic domain-containing protein n=1 Tax=Vitis rotundifolia TaxID=103349 RepID=A0AA39A9T6_VITRO|nr:hypothetical protein PVL29_004740 [Vitis rotundifolia]